MRDVNQYRITETAQIFAGVKFLDISIPARCAHAMDLVSDVVAEYFAATGIEPRVCIFGSGPAAVAAAKTAVLGPNSAVCVMHFAPLFSPQIGCVSRRIFPTLYSWPSIHWSEDWCELPFGWSAGVSSSVALEWQSLQKVFLRDVSFFEASPELTQEWGSSLQQIKNSADPQHDVGKFLELVHRSPPDELTFDLYFLCLGLKEYVQFSRYGGPKYWGNDSFENANHSVLHPAVIVGTGDGAMQDCIRLLAHGDFQALWLELWDACSAELTRISPGFAGDIKLEDAIELVGPLFANPKTAQIVLNAFRHGSERLEITMVSDIGVLRGFSVNKVLLALFAWFSIQPDISVTWKISLIHAQLVEITGLEESNELRWGDRCKVSFKLADGVVMSLDSACVILRMGASETFERR